MPHILHIPIKAAGELPRALYRVLYANLLRWLAIVEPDVAQEVHDRPVRKPFTISGLEESPDRRTWTWRVTLMEDELLALVSEVAYRGDGLDLGRKHCDVQWPDSKVASVSYDDLASKAGDETYLRMAFVSATTFAAGRLDSPLPEPNAVFHSWLSRWNDFAPPNCRMSASLLDVVREHVAVAEIRNMHTERHDLGRSSPVGCVGQVTYAVVRSQSLSRAEVTQINALASYAEFCGTGRKTTLGMGQTRRLYG